MKNSIILAGVISVLFSASAVGALSYIPPTTAMPPVTTGACVNLTRTLSFGSRGSDVSQLQRFLVSQNYPGGGAWMITGYFGAATQAAVRNFQSQRGLAQTGIVDAATRAALSVGCYTAPTNPGYPTYPTHPTYPTYPTHPTYPTYPTYPTPSTVSISSLSPNVAAPGTQITVYGQGFDVWSNTVYVGSSVVSSISSYNGTSLTFTVPSFATGVVQVRVMNSRGTSNTLSLTITSNSTCPLGHYCPPGSPMVSALSPNSGAVGTQVTVYGSGFSPSGNSVRFGVGIITGLLSPTGTSLSFTVPSQLTGFGSQMVTLGTYNVSVTNSQGIVSNALPFTVTSLGASAAPVITNVSGPSSLSTGNTGTWNVTVSPQSASFTSMSVRWGDEHLFNAAVSGTQVQSSTGLQTFSFTHAYAQSGTYTVTFTASNQSGQQNTASVTVYVTGTTVSQFSLSSVSPSSAPVGTTVLLHGSGFASTGNVVHFGSGGSRDLPSFNNGTLIYFTIPAWIGACSPHAQVCTMQAIQVTPGTYNIRVSNSTGTQYSQTLNFTVTN